jgi:EAL domain-containing protein (putative c-di-GMP-specific phosphodiesterase class I)
MLARADDGNSPYELVTFAEEVGIIEEFDLAICQRALDFLHPSESPETAVAINLSGRSLESGRFAQRLLTLLKPHQALAPRLLFELTESARIGALGHVNNVIQTLRQRGHRVALDDFGAGASSFPYLHELTVDFIKIDGAYVRGFLSSSRDAAILKSIVTLCHGLNVNMIAEMVETEAQAEALKMLGVDFGQGYLFGRPQSYPAEFEHTHRISGCMSSIS